MTNHLIRKIYPCTDIWIATMQNHPFNLYILLVTDLSAKNPAYQRSVSWCCYSERICNEMVSLMWKKCQICILWCVCQKLTKLTNYRKIEHFFPLNVPLRKWNSDFAQMAREKVMLCLPGTTADQTIYDTTMLKERSYFQALNDTRTAKAVEVVIGVSTRAIGNQPLQNVYSDMENEMTNFWDQESFGHPDALLRRGSTLYMGCDYLVRNNQTHVISTIVCVYGLLYFLGYHNNYKPTKGKTCSECDDFFNHHPALTTYTSSQQKWACDLLYPYLCRDTSDVNTTSESSHLFPCGGETVEQTTNQAVTYAFFTVPPDTEYDYTPRPAYDWPCYHISVPIALITIIVLIIIIYNIATVLSIRNVLKNKANV